MSRPNPLSFSTLSCVFGLWRIVVAGVALGLCAVAGLAGCKSASDQDPAASASAIVRIVHGPELRAFLSSAREQFMVSQPRLSNGAPVKIELVSEMGLGAAQSIARGEFKAEAWLSPSTSLVRYTNLTRINLGPEQDACRPLFSTPIILAARADQAALMGAESGTFSWDQLFPRKAKKGAREDTAEGFSLSHAQPRASTTGLGALIQLAYVANNGAELSVARLKDPEIERLLQQYQRTVSTYPLSEVFLLSKAAASTGSRPRFALTTAQQLAQFNQLQENQDHHLIGLVPKEGSYSEDYQLCTSNADWVSPGQRTAVQLFGDFLLSDALQRDAERVGFEPAARRDSAAVSDGTSTANSAAGSATGSKSLPAVNGDVVAHLLEAWPKLRRPAAFILVMDSSGSMDGDPLMVGKEQFRRLLAYTSENDLKGLVSFNSTPSVLSPLVHNSAEIFPKLDVIQSIGGSAVYDGIRTALGLAQDPALSAYRKMVVVFTDGSDKNSEVSLTSLVSFAKRSADESDINLFIIGVDREGSDFSDLEKIAQAADGTFRRSALIAMEDVFQEISKSF